MHTDRKNERKTLGYPGWIAIPDEPLIQCFIEDASDRGAKLVVEHAEAIPTLFKLLLSPLARTHRQCEVRWKQVGAIGVRYLRGAKQQTNTAEFVP